MGKPPSKATYVDAQLFAMLQAIQKRMARDPGWQVVARGRDWLCPYCGEVGFTNYDAHNAPKQVLKHLVHECPQWGEDVGTRFPHKVLVAKKQRLEAEDLLRKSSAWRMSDETGRWYCPYCGGATAVVWHPGGGDAAPPAEQVHAHLAKCPANRNGRKPYPPEVMTAIVNDADKTRRYTVAVRCKLELDPAWRETTQDGKWLCPRCRQAVPGVDISSEMGRVVFAPGRIARHLREGCRPDLGVTPAPGTLPPLHIEPEAPPAPAPAARPGPLTVRMMGEGSTETQLIRARDIVLKTLPTEAPQIEGYDLHCLYRPAKDVGGNFHDFFYLSPEDIALVVAATANRGLKAAMMMENVKKLLRRHGLGHRSPAEVLRRVNQDMAADPEGHTIVSVFYAVLDTLTGAIVYVRAGHDMPLLFNPQDEPPVRELSSKGMAIGLQKGDNFDRALEETELRLRPGDTLVAYTSGVVQAKNAQGEAYGIERLGAALAASAAEATSQALALRLFDDVCRFLGGAPQIEDITILCLRRR